MRSLHPINHEKKSLDAGIIWCFKAIYRQMFCPQAVDLNEVGEDDIYKINLLEAIKMAQEGWDQIEKKTIQNCWKHIRILPRAQPTTSTALPASDACHKAGEDIVWKFASTEMTLPQAENELSKLLGSDFVDDEWRPALKAVMDAEGNSVVAQECVNSLFSSVHHSSATEKATSNPPPIQFALTSQLQQYKKELLAAVETLASCKKQFEPCNFEPNTGGRDWGRSAHV